MHISFLPQRHDDVLVASKLGDALTLNGEVFDFSSIPEGGEVAASDVPCWWVREKVFRQDGEIYLTLLLPLGPNPSAEEKTPDPIIVVEDGPITLPGGGNVDA